MFHLVQWNTYSQISLHRIVVLFFSHFRKTLPFFPSSQPRGPILSSLCTSEPCGLLSQLQQCAGWRAGGKAHAVLLAPVQGAACTGHGMVCTLEQRGRGRWGGVDQSRGGQIVPGRGQDWWQWCMPYLIPPPRLDPPIWNNSHVHQHVHQHLSRPTETAGAFPRARGKMSPYLTEASCCNIPPHAGQWAWEEWPTIT